MLLQVKEVLSKEIHMNRFYGLMVLGLVLAQPAFAEDYSWKDKRQAECTQRANDRNMVNRQEFVDFCLTHNDAEVQRYWSCEPRADKRELGEDTRRSFLEWCVKQQKDYTPAQANRFAECNAQAAQQNIEGAYRDRYVARCVEGELK
jgi:hypothetical protein